MNVILKHNHFDIDHLENVKAEMSRLGTPSIRAIWDEALDAWIALEGCHRLRAAHALGFMPEMIKIDAIDQFASDLGLDWSDDAEISTALENAHRRVELVF